MKQPLSNLPETITCSPQSVESKSLFLESLSEKAEQLLSTIQQPKILTMDEALKALVQEDQFINRYLGLEHGQPWPTFEVKQVTAKPRKLTATWTLDVEEELETMHGLDLEAELMASLSDEIVKEIDGNVFAELVKIAEEQGSSLT